MINCLKKICLLLGSAYTLLGCQPNSEADWHKLWTTTQTFNQQKRVILHHNRKYLAQLPVYKTSQKRLRLRNQWTDLHTRVKTQLLTLDSIADALYQSIKQPKTNNVATQFVKAGDQQVSVNQLKKMLQPVIHFEDSLHQKYPQILKVKEAPRSVLRIFSTPNRYIAWAVAYTDLAQWQVTLLKKQQLILARQAKIIEFIPEYKTTPKLYLEAFAPSNSVIEGEKYEALMFLSRTGINKSSAPKMTVNGKPIPVYNGRGSVKFRPNKPGIYTWQGSVTFKDRGRDTTFTFKRQYKVLPK
ncbi:hypothetical protein [uncultured Microscilla sp.]|uniref:hypothetical protein n=1 Tax=uncultured Microscilla sp. TaxID=432653 RepID=UPI002624DD45|nr:hypothetical protein [uncultured Microscilla sp.]